MRCGFHENGIARHQGGVHNLILDDDIGVGLNPLVSDMTYRHRAEFRFDDSTSGAGEPPEYDYGSIGGDVPILDRPADANVPLGVDGQVVLYVALHIDGTGKGNVSRFQNSVHHSP